MENKIYVSRTSGKKVKVLLDTGLTIRLEELDAPRNGMIHNVDKKWFIKNYIDINDAMGKG